MFQPGEVISNGIFVWVVRTRALVDIRKIEKRKVGNGATGASYTEYKVLFCNSSQSVVHIVMANDK